MRGFSKFNVCLFLLKFKSALNAYIYFNIYMQVVS